MEGLAALIKTNVTLVGILMAKMAMSRPSLVSNDGMELIAEIMNTWANYDLDTDFASTSPDARTPMYTWDSHSHARQYLSQLMPTLRFPQREIGILHRYRYRCITKVNTNSTSRAVTMRA